MPSKKKKYNARFPAGRIKKIMQTDEDVGKVAQPVPIIISRTLELFVHSLLTKTMQITSAKNAKTLSPYHMKQCILSESRFDFLKDLVKGLPDVSGPDEDVPTPPLTPAPVSTNSNYSTLTYAQGTAKKEEEGEVSMTNTPKTSTKDIKITLPPTNSTIAFETQKVPCTPQAPEFQITVPASFQINQPNFYTELNPMNLSTNSSNTSSSNNPPTKNFINTANIDEDYDT